MSDILTLGRNFAPWFAAVALAAFLGGNWSGYTVARLVYTGRTERAERMLAEYKGAVAEAMAVDAQRQVVVRDEVRRTRDEQRTLLDSIHGDLASISRDARVCASTSTMRVPGAAAGVDEKAAGQQSRAADAVLQELASFLAARADSDAIDHNALIDWVTRTRTP